MNDLEFSQPSSYSWEGRFPTERVRRRKPKSKVFHPLLSEIILENTPRYEPVSSTDLYQRVVDDYGALCKRVFYRRMKKLRALGAVVVVERLKAGGYDQLLYVKAVSPSK